MYGFIYGQRGCNFAANVTIFNVIVVFRSLVICTHLTTTKTVTESCI